MKTKIISILALLLTVTQGAWAQTLPTDGTGAYLISSVDDWNTFCGDVTGGITYSGKTVKLTQNVGPVTTMAGVYTSFSGTFDGQGYTLTVSINVQDDNMGTLAAPFALIGGATIKNLHVAGNISVNRARPASIASFVSDDSEITNCKSSVSITASRGDWVDAGGFVARVDAGKALTMTGCTFAGSITYTNAAGYEGGGMVGWTQANASANLTNCLFAPTSVSFANSKSKADNNFRMLVNGVGSSTLTRCYYNDVAANNTKIITDGEGKQARSISAGTDVTISGLGDATATYNVSGITAYATGIKYNDVYYAGNGESVSLALSHADKAGYAFNQYAVAGGGTLTAQAETSATLSMADANQTINAQWTANTYSVRFNKNADDATGTMDDEAFTYDEAKALTANAFSRTGYTFEGWATTADGAVAYTDGQSVSNLTATDGATVDLYAHWTCNTTTSGIDWNPSTKSGTFLMPAYNVEVSTELWYKVDEEKTLAENIAAYGTKSNFFLNRTLTANVWNTFASPFAIAAVDMTKYFGAGAKVRQLNTTSVAGTVLTLNFTDASAIVAGQPYLVKPAANVDFSADGKEFAGVDLTAASATPTATTYVNFVPTLGKTAVTGDPKDILILNTSGTLVHPSAAGNMKGFRGYFVMHDAPAGAREFIMNFGDGETNGIQSIRMENGTTPAEGTYDLSGRRIQGQPTQKGVYIQNGKKVVIK